MQLLCNGTLLPNVIEVTCCRFEEALMGEASARYGQLSLERKRGLSFRGNADECTSSVSCSIDDGISQCSGKCQRGNSDRHGVNTAHFNRASSAFAIMSGCRDDPHRAFHGISQAFPSC